MKYAVNIESRRRASIHIDRDMVVFGVFDDPDTKKGRAKLPKIVREIFETELVSRIIIGRSDRRMVGLSRPPSECLKWSDILPEIAKVLSKHLDVNMSVEEVKLHEVCANPFAREEEDD